VGKVIGGCAAVMGVIILAMPIGLLSSHFTETFQYYKMKNRVLKKLKQKNQTEGGKKNKFGDWVLKSLQIEEKKTPYNINNNF
jgi:hypothetical protein